jgi:hypothetical protein
MDHVEQAVTLLYPVNIVVGVAIKALNAVADVAFQFSTAGAPVERIANGPVIPSPIIAEGDGVEYPVEARPPTFDMYNDKSGLASHQ